jgi:glycosyltransferase involved in cell wall biosynthesis
MPVFSIIMASYNYAEFIQKAIESVLEQTYTDWELIIVDDGSSDNSLDIIESYLKQEPDKIKCFTHSGNCNLGLKATLELAFSKVKGRYVAFLESDDNWQLNCLEKKYEVFEKFPEVMLVYSAINLIGERSTITDKHKDYMTYSRYIGKKAEGLPFDCSRVLWLRNPIVTFSNIAIRSEVIEIAELSKKYEIWSDWLIAFRAAILGKYFYIDEKLINWRVHSKSANFKYMNSIDPVKLGNEFKADMLKFIREYSEKKNNSEILQKALDCVLPPKALFYRFFHDFGFALYSPSSVIREFIRILSGKFRKKA